MSAKSDDGKTGFEFVLWKPPPGPPEGVSILRGMVREWHIKLAAEKAYREWLDRFWNR